MKSPIDPIEVSIRALEDEGHIHIERVWFPNYRSIREGQALPFDFPITALLGRNGTNKSSILHALYGCPKGATIADFWFETKLDAIPETVNGKKQSVAYRYVGPNGKLVECLKARAPRTIRTKQGRADPDYWEAVKPSSVYGFKPGTEREPPMDLEVEHLDFRGELPAFDKYFYFPDAAHLAVRRKYARIAGKLRKEYRKQDYLRQRAARLRNMIDSEGVALTEEELAVIRYILERDYDAGKFLEHSLFHGHQGTTLLFSTKSLASEYSEAFAGSGESAATLLVHRVLSVEDGSLILLDEPETSLHPRAQQRLMEFLAHYAVRKRLQIVLATHSFDLVERLPSKAIRVLESASNGKITIATSYSAREALYEIGTPGPGKRVYVEDERAKMILLPALSAASTHAASAIRIEVRSGGTSQIFKDLQTHSAVGTQNLFFVLDGDHRPEHDLPESDDLPQGKEKLEKIISEYTKGPNKKGPSLTFKTARAATAHIEFLRDFVFFLPGDRPEDLVWSEEAALDLLEIDDLPDSVLEAEAGKERLSTLAKLVVGMEEDAIFQLFVTKFLRSSRQELRDLQTILDRIRAA